MKALITRKVGMTSLVNNDGSVSAVTLLSLKPNYITQVKTEETDGYSAIQLGTEDQKNAGKATIGHLKKAKLAPVNIMREFRVDEIKIGRAHV